MVVEVSFIIVTYQRGDLLVRCLESIYAQTNLLEPFEVIVVDNDGSAQIPPAPREAIQLRIERPAENLGATGGRNLGMQLASGRILILLDDDALWQSRTGASEVVALFTEHPNCGSVALRSLTPDGDLIIPELPHPNKQYLSAVTQPVLVPYFYGMGHALRADVLAETGLYPERFIINGEEVDLSYRIIHAGYDILYTPGICVYHHRSDLGRPMKGHRYWKINALNKSRIAWRLLPLPYALTTTIVWSGYVLRKTLRPGLALSIWRDLWAERQLLADERQPVPTETIRRLRRAGARLLY